MQINLFPATRAFIIRDDGKVLIIRESNHYQRSPNMGKYDLPGGKIKPGERFDESLKREVKEETNLDIILDQAFSISEWRPVVNGITNHIVATFIKCFPRSNDVKLGEDFDDYQWINPADYSKYNLIETLTPAFEDYLKLTKR